ncbi:uncharacterized protein LAESUDRAFT_731696 [Laetiporus sulphureus 93-53]|uniref:Ricin B lectin domain-containing protein n=1 Tax=Laetiporus sulphureus 93-53 TaxID=1314785 RepID=A0A165BFX2_9APHY|nr:uncharacterized protein LAESUDRAFT_731696 [Laetiporus sulphureus 93-53]KZT00973.1 hypothetical protein LAESUDRAFT_731696 [Laetiporus sulphureus 93-53]
MSLDTGRYIIQNVRTMNFLTLPDPDDGTSIVATAEEADQARRWNVVQLGNGKYTIENQTHASYANTGFRPSDGAEVVGRANKQQFSISETRKKGLYTISPTDSQLCWGLVDDQEGTPLTLSASYTDPRNHWQFTRVRV